MSELEKILRESVGKVVSLRYITSMGDIENTLTGKLIKVTNEIIVIEAVMTHYINRKQNTLIGFGVK